MTAFEDHVGNYEQQIDRAAVHFQPRISLASGDIVGYEALLRVHEASPFPSLVSPKALIEGIDGLPMPQRHMLHKRLLERVHPEAYRLQRHLDLDISINVPAFLLCDAGVRTWLIRQAVSDLTLEVVETSAVADFDAMNVAIQHLRQHGYRICIDDFGKGYSTAAILAALTYIDEVKIDASFLSTPRSTRLLPSMCETIHQAGAVATIEGVESQDDHDICIQACADVGQGFWYGVPRAMEVSDMRGAQRLAMD